MVVVRYKTPFWRNLDKDLLVKVRRLRKRVGDVNMTPLLTFTDTNSLKTLTQLPANLKNSLSLEYRLQPVRFKNPFLMLITIPYKVSVRLEFPDGKTFISKSEYIDQIAIGDDIEVEIKFLTKLLKSGVRIDTNSQKPEIHVL